MSIKGKIERLERVRRRDRELDQTIELELDALADSVRAGELTIDRAIDDMGEFAGVTRSELRRRLT